MTAPDLSILDGLTDAQKTVLKRFRSEDWHDGLYMGSLHVQRPGVVCFALSRKGLLEKRGVEYRLTLLGQQIRTALLETEK